MKLYAKVSSERATKGQGGNDYFDIDDGYSGTVTNLNITTTTGNAGIEMSGTTLATFDGVKITQNGSKKEGGIFFKGDNIGAHLKNVEIIDNVDEMLEVKDDNDVVVDPSFNFGAIHSSGNANTTDTTFENVTISGSATGDRFTDDAIDGGTSAAIKAIFDAQ